MFIEDYEDYIAVIGAGPVGLSVTYNLLKNNQKVCLIDTCSNKNSNYQTVKSKRAQVSYSYKLGGLSNYWGSNISSFDDSDLVNWPIKAEALNENIYLLDEILDFTQNKKKIEFNSESNSKLEFGKYKKLNEVIKNFNKNLDFFESNKVQLINAIHVTNKNNFDKFNSSFLLKSLLHNQNLVFLQNFLFLKYKEINSVNIGTLFELNKEKNFEYKFKKILICAGTLNSTLIFSRSSKFIYNKFNFSLNNLKVAAVFSKYAITKSPLLSKFQINYKEYQSSINIHSQIYDFNKEYIERIQNKFLYLVVKLFYNFFPFLINRIFIILIYSHSDTSNKLEIEFCNSYFLKIKNMNLINKYNKNISMVYLKKILKNLNLLFFSIFSFNEPGGACNHLGSSLPMNRLPNKLQTDIYGKVHNLKNVHILDASILPSIPAKPVAFIAMLNALRITKNIIKSLKDDQKKSS